MEVSLTYLCIAIAAAEREAERQREEAATAAAAAEAVRVEAERAQADWQRRLEQAEQQAAQMVNAAGIARADAVGGPHVQLIEKPHGRFSLPEVMENTANILYDEYRLILVSSCRIINKILYLLHSTAPSPQCCRPARGQSLQEGSKQGLRSGCEELGKHI